MATLAPRRPTWILAAAWLTLATGCDVPTAPAPAPALPRVRLAAASDLQGAMPVLAAAFRQDRGIEIDATFGASGQLAQQVRQGGPFDVFLSANRGFVTPLVKAGWIRAGSARPYAQGTLVMVVNPIFNLKIKAMDDLKDEEVKSIAIANPGTAPYGIAAKQALERAGLWDALKSKVVPAESVGQALQFVRSGNAEVGFVGRSMADSPGLEVVRLPADACDPIIQVLGVVEHPGTHTAEADAFVAFLLGDIGQGILRDLGFARPPDEPSAPARP